MKDKKSIKSTKIVKKSIKSTKITDKKSIKSTKITDKKSIKSRNKYGGNPNIQGNVSVVYKRTYGDVSYENIDQKMVNDFVSKLKMNTKRKSDDIIQENIKKFTYDKRFEDKKVRKDLLLNLIKFSYEMYNEEEGNGEFKPEFINTLFRFKDENNQFYNLKKNQELPENIILTANQQLLLYYLKHDKKIFSEDINELIFNKKKDQDEIPLFEITDDFREYYFLLDFYFSDYQKSDDVSIIKKFIEEKKKESLKIGFFSSLTLGLYLGQNRIEIENNIEKEHITGIKKLIENKFFNFIKLFKPEEILEINSFRYKNSNRDYFSVNSFHCSLFVLQP